MFSKLPVRFMILAHITFDIYLASFSATYVLQLQCADEDVIDGAIIILKAIILKTNHTLSRRSLGDVREIDAFLPTLLNLLDERDAAAKAIVKLLAEYCSMYNRLIFNIFVVSVVL